MYTARIDENALNGTRLNVHLKLTHFSLFYGSIVAKFCFCNSTKPNEIFFINETTGRIYLKHRLDRQVESFYTLNICCLIEHTNSNTQLLNTILNVIVENMNDVPPQIITFNDTRVE